MPPLSNEARRAAYRFERLPGPSRQFVLAVLAAAKKAGGAIC
jgi:hypothetical protein